MTHMEIYQDGIRCHAALAQAKTALADTEKSLLASVEATVGYQHELRETTAVLVAVTAECDEALAAIERVWTLHFSEDNDRDAEWCVHDSETWPCSTIRALRATS